MILRILGVTNDLLLVILLFMLTPIVAQKHMQADEASTIYELSTADGQAETKSGGGGSEQYVIDVNSSGELKHKEQVLVLSQVKAQALAHYAGNVILRPSQNLTYRYLKDLLLELNQQGLTIRLAEED
jgi:hypothetical protein